MQAKLGHDRRSQRLGSICNLFVQLGAIPIMSLAVATVAKLQLVYHWKFLPRQSFECDVRHNKIRGRPEPHAPKLFPSAVPAFM